MSNCIDDSDDSESVLYGNNNSVALSDSGINLVDPNDSGIDLTDSLTDSNGEGKMSGIEKLVMAVEIGVTTFLAGAGLYGIGQMIYNHCSK